jgi:two-component system NtrC family response regulator
MPSSTPGGPARSCACARSADAFARIAGKNPRLRQAVETARRAAATNVPVLLVCETGTGKELFAHAIHAASPRSGGPFVAVNCSAIPESLAESELFGHEAGAFTGAAARRAGCFERAHGGTLFLDEIEAMPPAVQPKILRILQDCRGVRIGGTQPFAADARIFAATNRDPEALVREERLRADLFHRIGAITIRIPALRERPEDVPLLADLCLRRACERIGKPPLAWSAETIALLVRYSWPGNVREMENVSLHAALHADTDTVLPDHLPEALRQPDAPSPQAVEISLDAAVEALERWMIADALRRSGGVQTRAAELLGTTKRVIGYNIQKYGLAARPEP